jgi:uncharacterized membrane protein
MADKDVALGILQAAIAIGGLLLIFIGFVLGRADREPLKGIRVKIRGVAMFGLIPFIAALMCALQSLWAIQGGHGSAMYLFCTLKIVLGLTAIYAIMATFYEVR